MPARRLLHFAGVCALLVIALAAPLASAKPVTTAFKTATIVFNKPNAAVDPNATNVYVTFAGDFNPNLAVVTAPGFVVTSLGAGGIYQLSGGNLADKATLTLKVRSTGPTLKGVRVGDVIFQDAKGKPITNGQATGGTLVGDPNYTLHNDLVPSPDLAVGNLHFYYDHAPVDPDTLDPSSPLSGAYVLAGDAFLAGSGSFKDYTVPSIADGTQFLVQGDVLYQGAVVSQFIDGFSVAAIAEPNSALLTSAGMLALLALVAAQRRGQGSPHHA